MCMSTRRGVRIGFCVCFRSAIQLLPADNRGSRDGDSSKILFHCTVLFAPNPDLCQRLEQMTERPCFLMPRGVDADLFIPRNAIARTTNQTRCLDSWGVSPSRRILPAWCRCSDELEQMGTGAFVVLIVGHVAMKRGCASGCAVRSSRAFLRGEALSEAYCETWISSSSVAYRHLRQRGPGALPVGVPAVVTPDGGPKTIVRRRRNRRHRARRGVCFGVAGILCDPATTCCHAQGCAGLRAHGKLDSGIEGVYAAYEGCCRLDCAMRFEA